MTPQLILYTFFKSKSKNKYISKGIRSKNLDHFPVINIVVPIETSGCQG